jgi:hypothetical protein
LLIKLEEKGDRIRISRRVLERKETYGMIQNKRLSQVLEHSMKRGKSWQEI